MHNPSELVILTNPASRGVSQGSQTNARALLTYTEFLQLRDSSPVFSAVMACQSQPDRIDARVDGGPSEELRTRLVSAEYFTTLGVPAILGRAFAPNDDPAAPHAVISYAYWERRFGSRADILGTKIAIRKGVFQIISGRAIVVLRRNRRRFRPDVWLPLAQQPAVLPGRDWLHDKPGDFEKVMWLHVFARLKPGVTIDQAQSASNVVFQQGLAADHGAVVAPEARKEFLNQRLVVSPAATGVSQLRGQFAEPLTALLAAAALVLLIACANLCNLQLARTASRTREFAVRLALGAGRGRLTRQLLTESMLLAAIGGVAGFATVWIVRAALLSLTSSAIELPTTPDARVLAFAFSLTIAAGLLLGLLPSLCIGAGHAASGLKEQGRGLTGSIAWQRVGKLVVVGQLALSLPLLCRGRFARSDFPQHPVGRPGLCERAIAHRRSRRGGGLMSHRAGCLYFRTCSIGCAPCRACGPPPIPTMGSFPAPTAATKCWWKDIRARERQWRFAGYNHSVAGAELFLYPRHSHSPRP